MSTQTDDTGHLIDLVCRKSQAVKSKTGRREISVSAQEARGRKTAELLGLTVRHVWREVGSASRFRRSKKVPKQDLALQALDRGEIGALWVFRLDRWTRRGAGAILSIVEPADGRPRRLLVDNGDADNPGIGLDSSNPRDRSELIRRAEDAREETEVLSERVRNTKTFQLENGEWLSGVAPYGLRVVMVSAFDEDGEEIEERKLQRDPETSAGIPGEPHVTKMEIARLVTYEWPVARVTKREMARRLNDRAVPSPSGGNWAFSTVANMIGNPAYAGWQITGRSDNRSRRMLYLNEDGEKVSVMVGPALLAEEEYNEAQAASRGSGPPADAESWKPKHLLTDLLECSGCNSSMPSAGTSYACWRSRAGGVCPAPASAAAHSAEEYVFQFWSSRLHASDPEDPLLAIVAARWAARKDPQASEEEQTARAALADAERVLSRLWQDRRAGLFDGPSERFFAPQLSEANAAVTAAQKALDGISGTGPVDISFLLELEDQREAWEAADLPLKRDLLRLAIRRIRVHRAPKRGVQFDGDSRMEINWLDEPAWETAA
ncbi:recombinase family protein [Streptomyces sp. NBC_01006]|uniref:recombinase family protein n=1 Tax=Streptomyces sp. NBC_01006 TaxID=2903716 RepID=UPI00386D8B39|nr:recombinase family protein [Streptomyces sp. NBC_01006]